MHEYQSYLSKQQKIKEEEEKNQRTEALKKIKFINEAIKQSVEANEKIRQ